MVNLETSTLTATTASATTSGLSSTPVTATDSSQQSMSANTAISQTSQMPPLTTLSTVTAIGPHTTMTLHLAPVNPTPQPTASECPKPQASKTNTAPAGRIAGSVIGSMAGLALIILLLSWCMKRKRKIKLTFKRKNSDLPTEADEAKQVHEETATAIREMQRNNDMRSPRSFDFGLPQIPQHPPMNPPQKWI
jgi:hypothetical protein